MAVVRRSKSVDKKTLPEPIFSTRRGKLYKGDCIELLPHFPDRCVQAVFADPPFNLDKKYGSKVNDLRNSDEFLQWSRIWITECFRTLKPGGSMFIYSLPKWNIHYASIMTELGLEFRNWIAISMKSGFPIRGRLYPAHYSLLYFTKGKPDRFQKIRTPISKCRHCHNDIRDYGSHRNSLNPDGISLSDFWDDVSPVRHKLYTGKFRKANQLPPKIVERAVRMSTKPRDTVLDPFGGSGTTYGICEREKRRWIGIEIESCKEIIERLKNNTCPLPSSQDIVERS